VAFWVNWYLLYTGALLFRCIYHLGKFTPKDPHCGIFFTSISFRARGHWIKKNCFDFFEDFAYRYRYLNIDFSIFLLKIPKWYDPKFTSSWLYTGTPLLKLSFFHFFYFYRFHPAFSCTVFYPFFHTLLNTVTGTVLTWLSHFFILITWFLILNRYFFQLPDYRYVPVSATLFLFSHTANYTPAIAEPSYFYILLMIPPVSWVNGTVSFYQIMITTSLIWVDHPFFIPVLLQNWYAPL
jgi:hypothetical protein